MRKWGVVILLACAMFIMVLDSTVMNVSISEVVSDLGTTVSGLQAAITFYTLTMAALMLTGGKLGDVWGRLRAFRIGAVVYGVGSMITALSPNLHTLMFGWSLVEGLGAVLVIPAIASLLADNYKGRDRAIGYTLIGAASGIAVAAGPLIGGYLTTYASWRYVFAAETVIMLGVLLCSRIIKQSAAPKTKQRIDWLSVVSSAIGMGLLVLGILQSKTWGWVTPKTIPQINGVDIAPLGISIVVYLIVAGALVLWWFVNRQRKLERAGANPLLRVSMFSNKVLRSGLAVLGSQYLITASVFFVLPIYLQMVLGLDALQTGIRIFPLSVAIVIFSTVGSRLSKRMAPRRIVRIGQLALVFGAVLVLGSIDPELKGLAFKFGMVVLGSGLGLLVSQIGNVTISSVPESRSSEVGGLQGTFQNLGASVGTALVGSVIIASLTVGFTNSIEANPQVPANVKAAVAGANTEAQIMPVSEVKSVATQKGLSDSESSAVAESYEDSQLQSLKLAMVLVILVALLSIGLSRNIPRRAPDA
jgi:EmrB/QacA subfamily drug resistance transporter